jgi:anti-sigma factor RsiW
VSPTLNPMKLHHRRCREARAQMSDLIDRQLDERSAAAVERHARWCPNCRRMLKNLRRAVAGLRDLGRQPTPVDSPRR